MTFSFFISRNSVFSYFIFYNRQTCSGDLHFNFMLISLNNMYVSLVFSLQYYILYIQYCIVVVVQQQQLMHSNFNLWSQNFPLHLQIIIFSSSSFCGSNIMYSPLWQFHILSGESIFQTWQYVNLKSKRVLIILFCISFSYSFKIIFYTFYIFLVYILPFWLGGDFS